MQVHILPKHPHNCQNTPTYTHPNIKNKLKQPQYKKQTKWKLHMGFSNFLIGDPDKAQSFAPRIQKEQR